MDIFDFTVQDLEKNPVRLEDYRGKVLLIVNTATGCGLAGQTRELENLYRKYRGKDFVVLGFPSDQFMGQEPLDGLEIKNFCEREYGVSFPLFDKIKVNGPDASLLYKHLVKETGNSMIKWNYTKFLVDREGQIVKRYAPVTTPDKIEPDIRELVER